MDTLMQTTTLPTQLMRMRLLLLPFMIGLSLYNVSNMMGSEESPVHHRNLREEIMHSGDAPVVDIMSVGTLLKQEYHVAQEETFGRHPFVRDFYRIDERNDTDKTCFTELSADQMQSVIDFCANTEHTSYVSEILRSRLFEPKKQSGWLCAQKRPLDGLYQVLQQYVSGQQTIPDYLLIADDDSYFNIGKLVENLTQNFPPDVSAAVTGCKFDFVKELRFPFPYGGFGSYLTRAAIQRLIQPFYCDGRDEFSNLACWRKNQNELGEAQFYEDGMSVIDLMQAYGANLPFTGVDQWKKTGYCLHSDHALAYFINFYFVTVPPNTWAKHKQPKDRVRRRKPGFMELPGQDQCKNMRDECDPNEDTVCHYIDPEQMRTFYATAEQ